MTTLTHKIRLSPNAAQAAALGKACGCSRFAWNWCLNRYVEKKTAGEARVSINDLKKELILILKIMILVILVKNLLI